MKKKIVDFLSNVWEEITYNLKCFCGGLTPVKRLIIVLVIGGILSIAYIYTLVSSICNIGKQDAGKEYMELQHIEILKLQQKQDSINILNQQEYEYEQSDK